MAALPQEQPQSATGLFQSLSNFAGSLIAIAHTRLQLLTTELQEEVRQVGAILLWAFIAAFTALLGLFLGALAVIFVFWDTHRIAASLAMIGLFVAIAIGAGARCSRKKLRSKPPMLDDTLAELAKDRDNLKARHDEPALRSAQCSSQQPAGALRRAASAIGRECGRDRARAGPPGSRRWPQFAACYAARR